MTTIPRNAFRLLLGGVASGLLLVACGGGDVSPNAGEVRLVNATSEFGALDLYADSDRLSSGVAPFTAGGYEDLNKGAYDFSIRGGVAGATIATLVGDPEEGRPDDARRLLERRHAGAGRDRRDGGRARQGRGQAALLQHRVERQRRHRRLPDRHRRLVRRPRRPPPPSRPRSPTCRRPSSTSIRAAPRPIASASPPPATGPTSASIPTSCVGDREIVTVILSRTAGARAAERRGDGAGGRRDPGGQRLGAGAPGGGRRHRHGDGVLRHGDDRGARQRSRRASVGTYRLVPTGTSLVVTWSGGTVALPANTISGGGDYTLLVSDADRGRRRSRPC